MQSIQHRICIRPRCEQIITLSIQLLPRNRICPERKSGKISTAIRFVVFAKLI
ncbi:hypothetical protein SAMN04488557_2703 [Hyphomicrobium facile]|uniref:Uncharacterized protein n=1 Tax=Hyphomicrobium facile TaxID=51670 RepID=A0A1I7NPW3_9HYPH|nr:hypothetical protein SAMN04488557_2703 [Hyphomicrobium facile]